MSEFYEYKRNDISSRYSRYKNCKLLVDENTGEKLLATRESLSIQSSPTDTYHRVKSNESDRLDIIASMYYKNPLLWWVIAEANGIYDPLTPLEIGSLVRVPAIETLYGNGGILL